MISPEDAEELACLDVLGLLEPPERGVLQTLPDPPGALRALRRELHESVCQLAWLAPASEPPERLRTRVLATIAPTGQQPPL